MYVTSTTQITWMDVGDCCRSLHVVCSTVSHAGTVRMWGTRLQSTSVRCSSVLISNTGSCFSPLKLFALTFFLFVSWTLSTISLVRAASTGHNSLKKIHRSENCSPLVHGCPPLAGSVNYLYSETLVSLLYFAIGYLRVS